MGRNNYKPTGGDKSTSITLTAPSSGTCTLSGFYQFAGESKKYFETKTITIMEDGEVSKIDLNTTLFELGSFKVTLLVALIFIVVIFLLLLLKK